MIRNITVIALVVGLLSVSCTSTETGAEDKVLKIAIAANMQYPMDSITTVFTELTGITCEVTSNSSGMLTAQIQNGAPFDLFLST
ncbi:MAG: substrate-binding domain-containing protein, partial [Crocinitomicaceae bacterium]|nr:substrate-binding domain-containing protein [Crocinitomicaceae bacterium]